MTDSAFVRIVFGGNLIVLLLVWRLADPLWCIGGITVLLATAFVLAWKGVQ